MIDPKRLDDFNGIKVLVIGDAMVDKYDFCQPVKLSQEAPVPVIRIMKHEMRLGGAANLAANLNALGAKVGLVSAVGAEDGTGSWLEQDLRAKNISTETLFCARTRTTTKRRIYAEDQQVCRVDEDIDDDLVGRHKMLMPVVRGKLDWCDVVALSDYRKGMISDGVIDAVKNSGKPWLVDAKPPVNRFLGASLIKMSSGDLHPPEGWRGLRDLPVDNAKAVVTLGDRGMLAVEGDEDAVLYPTRKVQVRDATGAGDVAMAALTLATAAGWNLADACRLANLSAGISVCRIGTNVVSREDVIAAIGVDQGRPRPQDFLSKCVIPDEAVDVVASWRSSGYRIGLVNGCFDILHPGHFMFIAKARNRCDRLMVLINTDNSYERVKGRKPANTFADRSIMVAAMASVDAVSGFDMDSPSMVIGGLRPHVYFYGWDHEINSPECDAARDAGAECIEIQRYQDHSTTAIKERIKGDVPI